METNKKYNLKDLFSEYKKIEIPKIQRDYAQGREEEKEVRERFLENIFSALKDNKTLELDFIYGSEHNGTLSLLDGQQRITTLFLLNWYLALKELDNFEGVKYLEKFTYSTRISSRDFCKNLISKIENIKKIVNSQKNNLSEILKEFSWLINHKDPTIKAMLNMLDAIDSKYRKYKGMNINNLFDNLQNIKFYVLPLKDFNLTDEIYIKMNARGKPLTDFENFKADLTNWIKDENNLFKDRFNESIKYHEHETKKNEEISMKLDNEWTDLFWEISKKYKNSKENKNEKNIEILDYLFLKFFYRITLNYFIISNFDEKNNKQITEDNDYKILFEEEKYRDFNAFKKTFDNDDNIFHIFNILDFLTKDDNYNNVVKDIKPIWENDEENIFLKDKVEYKDRIIFVSFILYFQKNNYKYDEIKFKQWMRVVWNIFEHFSVDNSNIDNAIKLIYELSEHSSNIYDFLSNEENKIESKIANEYIELERRKCQFIVKDSNWEKEFKETEKHLFFRGYIDFLIDYNMDIDKFKHRSKMLYETFDNNGINDKFGENHLFLRALISNINYLWDLPDEHSHYCDKGADFLALIKNKKFHDALNNNQEYKMNILIRNWFDDSKDINELSRKLEELVKRDSKIIVDDDKIKEERVRIAHEALYKDSKLMNWMQENGARKIQWERGNIGNICVKKPHSPYLKVLIGSYRNKLIKELIYKYKFQDIDNFELKYKEDKIGYYCCFDVYIVKDDYIFYFERDNMFYIERIKQNSKEKEPIKKYNLNEFNYKDIIDKLDKEIFNKK